MADETGALAPTDTEGEFSGEEYQPRRDGTIVLRIDGTRFVIKRPKFKELRTIKEAVRELDRQLLEEEQPVQDQLRVLRDQLKALADDDEEGQRPIVEGIDGVLNQLREVRDRSALRQLTWFRDGVLGVLGTPKPNESMQPEDLPTWLVSQEFLGELSDHWASVPRRPGVG